MKSGPVVVIGGSVAGYTVASRLRQHGFDGEITLIDPEGLPYERPPLSKQLLLGESDTEDLILADTSWFTEHGVELRHARVQQLQLGPAGTEHTITLNDGAQLTAATVVLATGAEPISLGVETTDDGPAPDPADPRVLTLRHRDDVAALRQLLDEVRADQQRPMRIAVVGAGVLGAELASSLRNLGAEVVLFSGPGIPAAGLVGHRLATRLHAQHADHGVSVVPEYAASIQLNPGSPASASATATGTSHTDPDSVEVLTLSGTAVPADAVISAIGISPNTQLAEDAGLEVADGVIVDAAQRSSHPDVFAVGDVARHEHAPRRTEHWQHAIDTASTAAAVIAGVAPPSPGPEWFWSDRYGVHVEAIGSLRAAATETPATGYTVVHREDPEHPEKLATFVLDDSGLMLGAASVDDPLAVRAARRIIQRGLVVDPARLADPDVSYKSLAR